MPPLDYEIEELAALSEIVHTRASKLAMQKFCTCHQDYYTEQSRNYLNVVPKDLHEQARNLEQAKQYAAMAKAWGTMWAELEMVAK